MAVDAFDLAVVGAGIVGSACAAVAAEAGLRVVLIEPFEIGSAATAAGMGHVVLMDDSPRLLEWTRLCRQYWLDWQPIFPASVEFRRTGTVWLAESVEHLPLVEAKSRHLADHGIRCEVWGSDQLREKEPALREGLAGALYVPDDVVLYPPAAAAFFVQRARQFQTKMLLGQRVVELLPGEVRLNDGSCLAVAYCLLANGAEAKQLVPWLPLVPRKGHLLITARGSSMVRHQLIELGYHDSVHRPESVSVAFNVQPRVTGQLLIGSSRQPGLADRRVEWPVVQRMVRRALEFLPDLVCQPIVRIWTGVRVTTPDEWPMIGFCDGESRVLVATGYEGLGVTAALGTAHLVVRLLLGEPPPIPAAWFAPQRLLSLVAVGDKV